MSNLQTSGQLFLQTQKQTREFARMFQHKLTWSDVMFHKHELALPGQSHVAIQSWRKMSLKIFENRT